MRPPKHPKEERINARHVAGYLLEQLNLERGLGYTLKKLLLDPKGAIEEFLFVDRRRMVKPIPLLLLVTGLTVFLSFQLFDFESDFDPNSREMQRLLSSVPPLLKPTVKMMSRIILQYFNILLISSIPFAALMTYWMFSEQRLYFTEHLVINAYIYSIQTLFTIILLPFLEQSKFFLVLLGVATLGYMVFAITKIFDQSWKMGFAKTVAIYLGAQLLYNIFIFICLLVISQFF